MAGFLIRWFGSAIILLIVANGIGPTPERADPFVVNGFGAALVAVVILTLGNLILQPLALVVKKFGCLLNVATLGLFGALVSFIFWAFAFYLVGDFTRAVPGFEVTGFGTAALGAFWMSVGNALLTPAVARFQKDRDDRDRRDERRR